jgi:hypothetical protein
MKVMSVRPFAGSKSKDCGWESEGSGDANTITSQKMDWGMAQIRLGKIQHFPLLKCVTIITIAVAAVVTKNDTHGKEFIIHISFAPGMEHSLLVIEVVYDLLFTKVDFRCFEILCKPAGIVTNQRRKHSKPFGQR